MSMNIKPNTRLNKAIDPTICLQQQDDCLIVMTNDIPLTVLNMTSQYIYNNCDGKTAEEISNMLFDECIDNETLNKQQVIKDCIEAIGIMSGLGLIKCENSAN